MVIFIRKVIWLRWILFNRIGVEMNIFLMNLMMLWKIYKNMELEKSYGM